MIQDPNCCWTFSSIFLRDGPSTADMSYWCWVEGKGHHSQSAGDILPNAAQEVFFSVRAHCWLLTSLLSTETSRFFSSKLLRSLLASTVSTDAQIYSYLVARLGLLLCLPSSDSCYPSLQPVEVSMNGCTTIWSISHSSQVCIIPLAESAVCPIVQVTNGEVKQYLPWYEPLWYANSDWPIRLVRPDFPVSLCWLLVVTFLVTLLSWKWDHLACVQYANIHTEQTCCLYCIFAQMWVPDDNSTKLANCLAESQGLYTLTKIKKLLIFWLVHHITWLSWRYAPSSLHYSCS